MRVPSRPCATPASWVEAFMAFMQSALDNNAACACADAMVQCATTFDGALPLPPIPPPAPGPYDPAVAAYLANLIGNLYVAAADDNAIRPVPGLALAAAFSIPLDPTPNVGALWTAPASPPAPSGSVDAFLAYRGTANTIEAILDALYSQVANPFTAARTARRDAAPPPAGGSMAARAALGRGGAQCAWPWPLRASADTLRSETQRPSLSPPCHGDAPPTPCAAGRFPQACACLGGATVMLHFGFVSAYAGIRASVRDALAAVHATTPIRSLYITGHSLGGALAALTAFDMAGSPPAPGGFTDMRLYTFASPRVGNPAFSRAMSAFTAPAAGPITSLYAVVNEDDLVPQLPPSVIPDLLDPSSLYYYCAIGNVVLFRENWLSITHNHTLPIYVANLAGRSPCGRIVALGSCDGPARPGGTDATPQHT